MREQAVLANVMFGFLLIFTGANVPVSALPGWMQSVSNVLPFTHGIEAARELADGAPLADVADLLGAEVAIGVVFGTLGYLFIRSAERLSLRHATLDRA
jgi:ABC-2 type transport system permease protein